MAAIRVATLRFWVLRVLWYLFHNSELRPSILRLFSGGRGSGCSPLHGATATSEFLQQKRWVSAVLGFRVFFGR